MNQPPRYLRFARALALCGGLTGCGAAATTTAPPPARPEDPPSRMAARGCDVCSCAYGSVSPPTCSGQLTGCCDAVWGVVVEGPLSPPDLAEA